MINALRERWGFMGTPVRLLFVKGGSDRAAKTASQRQGRKKRTSQETEAGGEGVKKVSKKVSGYFFASFLLRRTCSITKVSSSREKVA